MMRLGLGVVRSRWWVVLLWTLLAAVMIQFIPKGDPADSERASFLPADSNYSIAMSKLADSFPKDCALATAVLVAERPGCGLTAEDNQWIETLAAAIVAEEQQANPDLPPIHRRLHPPPRHGLEGLRCGHRQAERRQHQGRVRRQLRLVHGRPEAERCRHR